MSGNNRVGVCAKEILVSTDRHERASSLANIENRGGVQMTGIVSHNMISATYNFTYSSSYFDLYGAPQIRIMDVNYRRYIANLVFVGHKKPC